MDFILGANFPNKAVHRMTPTESEELNRQVKKLLQKGLIRESLSLCDVLVVLAPKKNGDGGCALILELSTRSQSSIDFHCQGWMILWTI